MSLYYEGNLEEDLKCVYDTTGTVNTETLKRLGKELGYGRCQQILQVLWAKELKDKGLPTNGALFR